MDLEAFESGEKNLEKTGGLINEQLVTRWRDQSKSSTETLLRFKPVPPLRPTELLAEVIFFPTHGSFWLASDPIVRHPRAMEFLSSGEFVFGNGGVGRVLRVGPEACGAKVGDYVAIMGHYSCDHEDCHGCRALGCFVECDYGEGKILGHGKGALDGSFSKYVILPMYSWVVCAAAPYELGSHALKKYMYAYIVADVNNALRRIPEIDSKERVLLVGAGISGHLFISSLLSQNSSRRFLVVDVSYANLQSIKEIAPSNISTFQIRKTPPRPEQALKENSDHKGGLDNIMAFGEVVSKTFRSAWPDLVIESSSGDCQEYWLNTRVLKSRVSILIFGFGMQSLVLPNEVLQLSGLSIFTSRGVGDSHNIQTAINCIAGELGAVVEKFLIEKARRFSTLEAFANFVKKIHEKKESAWAPNVYVTPNES
jgi:threonine dehydrogenase-like Zn-dependent dehydrogenase